MGGQEMLDTKTNSEVLGVLMALGIEYINKLPESVMDYLTQNCDKSSIPSIDSSIPINEQPISNDAKSFILFLNILYFCDSEEKRIEILNQIKRNGKK